MLYDAYACWRELAPAVERERTSLEDKVQYLTDKIRIQEMINEYAFACDSRGWDVLERLYDENIERVMKGWTRRSRVATTSSACMPSRLCPAARAWSHRRAT